MPEYVSNGSNAGPWDVRIACRKIGFDVEKPRGHFRNDEHIVVQGVATQSVIRYHITRVLANRNPRCLRVGNDIAQSLYGTALARQ